MKIMRLFIVICAISFCSTNLFAQIPGYMGKRFVMGYGLYSSPGIIGSGGETPLNILNEGYIEYATAKKFMVGFSGKFYKAVYGNGRMVEVNGGGYSSSAPTQIDKQPAGTYDIRAMNYMLYGKVFSGNYLAPWGRYFMFGLTINTFKATYNPAQMKVAMVSYGNYYGDNRYYTYSNFGAKEQSFTKFDISFGFGRSRIVANRVSIDYGYNINLIAMGLTLFDAPDDNIFGDETLYANKYIEKTSAARIRGVNRFNFFCKVGVLLF